MSKKKLIAIIFIILMVGMVMKFYIDTLDKVFEM